MTVHKRQGSLYKSVHSTDHADDIPTFFSANNSTVRQTSKEETGIKCI